MRKLSLAATAALVLVVAGVTLASASAWSSATQPSDKKPTQVIHLVARTIQDATLDRGEPGDSLGDQFIFSGDLFHGDRKVSHDGGGCTLVRLVPRVSASLQPPGSPEPLPLAPWDQIFGAAGQQRCSFPPEG